MRNPVAKVARIIAALCVLLALAGCSTVKLAYGTLPDIAYWWIDGYLDLDDAQGQRVKEDIARVHTWHRTQELPAYVALLARMERITAADTTAEQVCAFEPEIDRRILALREQVEPAMATTALQLQAAQLEHLQRKYASNNRDFEKDWLRLPPEELLDKRMKQSQERFESVYGSLSEAQRSALRQHLERIPFDARQVLRERQRRQQDALAVLRRLSTEAPPPDKARAAVRGLLERMLVSPDPAYRAYQLSFRRDTCRMIAALHNSAGPAQREQAARRLRGWQRDLQELAHR